MKIVATARDKIGNSMLLATPKLVRMRSEPESKPSACNWVRSALWLAERLASCAWSEERLAKTLASCSQVMLQGGGGLGEGGGRIGWCELGDGGRDGGGRTGCDGRVGTCDGGSMGDGNAVECSTGGGGVGVKQGCTGDGVTECEPGWRLGSPGGN